MVIQVERRLFFILVLDVVILGLVIDVGGTEQGRDLSFEKRTLGLPQVDFGDIYDFFTNSAVHAQFITSGFIQVLLNDKQLKNF